MKTVGQQWLILERKDGQRIILETSDGTIEIVLYNAQKGRTKIGIEAPETVKIIRKELLAVESSHSSIQYS